MKIYFLNKVLMISCFFYVSVTALIAETASPDVIPLESRLEGIVSAVPENATMTDVKSSLNLIREVVLEYCDTVSLNEVRNGSINPPHQDGDLANSLFLYAKDMMLSEALKKDIKILSVEDLDNILTAQVAGFVVDSSLLPDRESGNAVRIEVESAHACIKKEILCRVLSELIMTRNELFCVLKVQNRCTNSFSAVLSHCPVEIALVRDNGPLTTLDCDVSKMMELAQDLESSFPTKAYNLSDILNGSKTVSPLAQKWALLQIINNEDLSYIEILEKQLPTVGPNMKPAYAEAIWRLKNPDQSFSISEIRDWLPLIPKEEMPQGLEVKKELMQ
jgi:hypothetical protein